MQWRKHVFCVRKADSSLRSPEPLVNWLRSRVPLYTHTKISDREFNANQYAYTI